MISVKLQMAHLISQKIMREKLITQITNSSVMNFSMIIKLWFLLLICPRVISSGNLFSRKETFSKDDDNNFDNILRKFFVDLNKAYLQIHKPRHITVVGASTKELQQIQPLFERYPYIICKEIEKCEYSQKFSQGSMVVFFLEDFSEEKFGKNVDILSLCEKCKVLFVSNGIIKINEIWFIFTLAMQHVPYSEFAHLGKNVVKLYSDFVASNCSMEIRLVTVWRPGALDKIITWAYRSRRMNGCPVSVSSLLFTPKMMIKENRNGSLTIVGGREGNLVLTLANKLNFTISLRYPSMEDQLKYSRKEAILNDVATGLSEIGIGRLRDTNNLNNTITASFWYDEECVTWGVPRIINWSNDIVWVEFSWEVWAAIGLVFAVSCAIGYIHRNVVTIRNDEGIRNSAIFLDAITIHLGNPVAYVSTSAGGRFILIAYLYYAMVITTAYKTSLASILTTDEGIPSIVDTQGIIDANLKLGGSLYDYNILKDQVNDSEVTPKLLERFVINNNDSVTWEQLVFDQDYAYLARRSALDYERQRILKSDKSVTYDVLNSCALAYPTVMIFQKKSFLRRPVNDIIWRLIESGILKHWDVDKLDADKLLEHKSAEKYYEERATHKFRNIFILYFSCIAISSLTFLLELLTAKLYSRKRRRIKN